MAIEKRHSETQPKDRPVVVRLETKVEELEEKIAPGSNLNHNETFVKDTQDASTRGQQLKSELDAGIEDLEEKIALGHNLNHNETFVNDRR